MKTKIMYFVLRAALISLIIMFNSGCSPEDDLLSSTRTDYTGNQLRINGYYYHEYPAYTKDNVTIFFLYKNGIILRAGSFAKIDSSSYESIFIAPGFLSGIKETKYDWGAFKIEGFKIQFEHWGPGEGSMPAFNYSGDILNDTTFHITKLTRASGSFIRALDDTYHFKHFSPKPDSTNNFVK